MMQWFGESWGAPICKENKRITTPVEEVCGLCGEPIQVGDAGVRMPFAGDPTGRGYTDVHRVCLSHALFGQQQPATEEHEAV